MNFSSFRKLLPLFLILFCSLPVCEAQRGGRNPEKELFGRSLNTKRVKYRESPSVVRAKKKQAANQEKLKKDYADYVKNERRRAVEIQSPEVRERITANRKESDLKYKEKKKKRIADGKKAGRKFR